MTDESAVSVDLLMDAELVARVERYAQQHGISVETLLLQGVVALLTADDAGED